MDTIKIYDAFRQLFPLFDVRDFRRFGEYSIFIETSIPGMEFIFTFRSPSKWRFETAEIYGTDIVKEKYDEHK